MKRLKVLQCVLFVCIASESCLVATARETSPVRVVVAQDGSGDFRTVQMAIDHAPPYGGARLIVEIRPGIYQERVTVPQDRPRVTFLGTDAMKTVIRFNSGAKDVGGTFFSSTADIEGTQFEASNITFENFYGTGTQAVALMIHSDKAVFQKCRFLGWQDTLYAASGRQYYRDCFIAGHVDFIFGNAAAVFENCEIHSRGPGYITAESRTTPDGATGYVFLHCKLTGEDTGKGVYLGRPWRPYSRVIFLNCWLGDHILPEGWSNWNKTENFKTTWYAEYGSTGPGAKQELRVPWAHSLAAADVAQFQPDTFLRGSDGWQPEKVSIP